MKKNKKAQAVLPFFGLQLASVIVFLVVIISLFMIRRNLIMFTNEFNEATEGILLTRRMLSTADCFAYESKDIVIYNQSGTPFVILGSRIFPFIVDANKLIDIRHINCMRKDFYDNIPDAEKGIINIEFGSGAAIKYEISVYDLTDRITYTEGSVIGALEKENVQKCYTSWPCYLRYGSNFTCSGSTFNFIKGFLGWQDGICSGPDGTKRSTRSLVPSDILYDIEYFNEPVTNPESVINCETMGVLPHTKEFPVMLKIGDAMHPSIMKITYCFIEAINYDGIPFCQRSFSTIGGETCN